MMRPLLATSFTCSILVGLRRKVNSQLPEATRERAFAKLLWYWMKLAHKTKKLADTINCENNELDEIRGSIHNLCGTIDSVGCVQLAPINNYIVDEYLEQSIENGIELYKSQNWQLED